MRSTDCGATSFRRTSRQSPSRIRGTGLTAYAGGSSMAIAPRTPRISGRRWESRGGPLTGAPAQVNGLLSWRSRGGRGALRPDSSTLSRRVRGVLSPYRERGIGRWRAANGGRDSRLRGNDGARCAPTAVPSPAAFAASSPLIGRGGIGRWRAANGGEVPAYAGMTVRVAPRPQYPLPPRSRRPLPL